MKTLDWMIVGAFGLLLLVIVVYTNRITKSVAGFLSSERCAGRYLLTIATSMAFVSAIGAVSTYENIYRSGISGKWWGLLMGPVGAILALSGWVIYRYRETRCLTMAELLEKRYSRRFRIFAGFTAFVSGILNCAVFPLVTAHFMIYLLDLPTTWGGSLGISTHFTVMLIMVSIGVTLALAGGQITIMVTDFFQGVIGTASIIAVIVFVLGFLGWNTIINTLERSEEIRLLQAEAGNDPPLPEWYEEKAGEARAFHAAVTADQPEIFEVLRRQPALMSALREAVDEAQDKLVVNRPTELNKPYTALSAELLADNPEAAAALETELAAVVAEAEKLSNELSETAVNQTDDSAAMAEEAMAGEDEKVETAIDAATLAELDADDLRPLAMNLPATESIVGENYPDAFDKLSRSEGSSMMNPLKLGSEGAFSIPFFLMQAFLIFAAAGIWQGGAGYMTAARTPHEAKMGGILGGWRWLAIGLGGEAIAVLVYVVMWNGGYGEQQEAILAAAGTITDPYLQSQQFVPVAIAQLLPAGVMGLFVIFMIGSSISTDDSAYHSWGSIFLQDVIMPFRKKPFERKQHLRYLRFAIVGVAAFCVIFSSFFELRDFIHMWWQITMAIYIGGAMCAVIGGLYWSRGTTAGAWSGMITGSVLSLSGIAWQQFNPDTRFPAWVPVFGDEIINGQHLAVANIIISFGVYVLVSLATCRTPYNLQKLLNRGEYTIKEDDVVAGQTVDEIEASAGGDVVEPEADAPAIPWVLRKIGITQEFSRFDTFIYVAFLGWTTAISALFLSVTGYYLVINPSAPRPSSEAWVTGWAWFLGVHFVIAVITGVWYALGGARDTLRLVREVKSKEVDDADDGYVRESE
ncbi:MAG: hypothetical protein AAGH99_09650 [Planctomycetota bacterium]